MPPNWFTPGRGAGDMFLKVTGGAHGPIKGEAKDDTHKEEIEVLGWSWGIQGSYSGPEATSKSKVADLKILKRVDRATPQLMTAMRRNEEIKEAILTVRKAGEGQLEFLQIKIRRGRITGINIEAGNAEGGPDMLEHVSFAFNEIQVGYSPQGSDGRKEPTLEFIDTSSQHL